jgi:NADH-quinone oxidoreductase subunit H
MDQLMNFAWKFMLPMALINLVNAGIWHFMPIGPLRWVTGAILVIVPYVLLGRGLMQSNKLERRVYRFAE